MQKGKLPLDAAWLTRILPTSQHPSFLKLVGYIFIFSSYTIKT